MGKHITDHNSAKGDGKRVSEYARIAHEEAGEGRHPNTKALRQRPRQRDASKRREAFGRIDRGEKA